MLPPSWKAEIENAIEDATHAANHTKKNDDDENASKIAAEIKRLCDTYRAEKEKPKARDQVKCVLDIATVALLCVTTVFTGAAWLISRGQLKSMEADQRAWIGPPEINAIVENNVVNFSFTFKNSGRTPTRGFWVDADIFNEKKAPVEQPERMCWEGKDRADKNAYFLAPSVVPGATTAIPIGVTRSFKNVPLAELTAFSNPHIMGCAVYRLRTGDSLVHQTGFIAEIEVAKDGKGVSFPHIWAVRPD